MRFPRGGGRVPGVHGPGSFHRLHRRAACSPVSPPCPASTIVGTPAVRAGVVSFVLAGHSPQAVGQHLNREGIAVRAGHHCAQPILRRFGHEATVRPSLGIYNDDEDVARLIKALQRLAATTK